MYLHKLTKHCTIFYEIISFTPRRFLESQRLSCLSVFFFSHIQAYPFLLKFFVLTMFFQPWNYWCQACVILFVVTDHSALAECCMSTCLLMRLGPLFFHFAFIHIFFGPKPPTANVLSASAIFFLLALLRSVVLLFHVRFCVCLFQLLAELCLRIWST